MDSIIIIIIIIIIINLPDTCHLLHSQSRS